MRNENKTLYQGLLDYCIRMREMCKMCHALASTTTNMFHPNHLSSPVEYRTDRSDLSLESSLDSGGLSSFAEGPGPSRLYQHTSAMPLVSTPVSVPQTPLGRVSKFFFSRFHDVSHHKKASLGGFASPYDAYTQHLSQEVSRFARENNELKIQLETTR
jgi:hypothetical protein